jgi:hypothetical protein
MALPTMSVFISRVRMVLAMAEWLRAERKRRREH